ncbi:hypothetical protein BC829DRAFT_227750 [Chytridium lagenaria]|nr:hypothetical protein BC829DRAFT_227750 [Chytridium lagenaria]
MTTASLRTVTSKAAAWEPIVVEKDYGSSKAKEPTKSIDLTSGQSRHAETEYAISHKSSELYQSIFKRAVNLRDKINTALNATSENDIPIRVEEPRRTERIQTLAQHLDSESDFDDAALKGVLDDLGEDVSGLEDLDDLLVLEALNSKGKRLDKDLDDSILEDDYDALLTEIENLHDISNLIDDDMVTIAKAPKRKELPEEEEEVPLEESTRQKEVRFEEAKVVSRDTEAVMASLSQVHAARINIDHFAISSAYVYSSKAKFTVEFLFPHVTSDKVVQMTAVALPRFSSSSIKSVERNIYTIPFDKQDVFNLHFGDLLSSWFKSKVEVMVSAERLKTEVPFKSGAPELWKCFGSLNCKEIVMAENFLWKGRVPLWCQTVNAAAFPRLSLPNQASGRKKSQKVTLPSPTFIGDMVLTIELLTFPSFVYGSLREEPEGKKKDETRPSSPVKEDGRKEEARSKTPIEETPSPYSIPPHYLYIKISNARALALAPSTTFPSSVLLHLVLRLVSSMLPATTTPPIPYMPPFDIETGRLNPSPNFDFTLTLPLALNSTLISSSAKFPAIVEVWATFLGDMDRRKDSSSDGATLIGLVRLPVNHLLETAFHSPLLNKKSASSLEDGMKELPLMIPETEYCIVDPFSGSPKGWLKCFMSLGTWDQTLRVQEDPKVFP